LCSILLQLTKSRSGFTFQWWVGLISWLHPPSQNQYVRPWSRFGYAWPSQLDCNKFPNPKDDICVGRAAGRNRDLKHVRRQRDNDNQNKLLLCCYVFNTHCMYTALEIRGGIRQLPT
jgi:hypothetical protein